MDKKAFKQTLDDLATVVVAVVGTLLSLVFFMFLLYVGCKFLYSLVT